MRAFIDTDAAHEEWHVAIELRSDELGIAAGTQF
jgi:hypothetical protein